MADRFGIFAEDLRVRIHGEPKDVGKMVVVNGSIGFKQYGSDAYANEWVKLKFFPSTADAGRSISKGDAVKVSGRMALEEREWEQKTYRDWVILVDSLEPIGGIRREEQSTPASEQMDDLPF